MNETPCNDTAALSETSKAELQRAAFEIADHTTWVRGVRALADAIDTRARRAGRAGVAGLVDPSLVEAVARALWTGERCTTVSRKVPGGEAGGPLHVFVTADPVSMARGVMDGSERTESAAKVEATMAEVAKALDDYRAPDLLRAAVRCERLALLDPAKAGEWIERSGRLRELAQTASAIGC